MKHPVGPGRRALDASLPHPGTSAVRALATVRAYVELTKPRIILLLLLTTVAAMAVASPRHTSLPLLAATLLGGALTAGCANALNMYVDRDIDALMRRTRLRPLPSGRMDPAQAVMFAVMTGGAGLALLALGANLLSALLAASGILFYVAVYTCWLKRRTPQNIVIGGAAGAVPPLVGWAAATGHLAPPAWGLFAIVFLWTPPHFWALALRREDDYRTASVPMLPVARGQSETRRQIGLYALALSAASFAVSLPGGLFGPLYLATAAVLDALLLWIVWRVSRGRPGADTQLFAYSVLYLAVLFTAMAVDRVVVSPL
jgi:protoheme IX farnesyltransferase